MTQKNDVLEDRVTDPNLIKIQEGFNVHSETNLEDLEERIRARGVLTALWVRPNTGNAEQPYILIHGERRLRSIKSLREKGKYDKEIPIKVFDVDEDEAEDLLFLEHLAQGNISFSEETEMVARWRRKGYSLKEIEEKTKKSASWVEQRIQLATGTKMLKVAVASDKIPFSVGVDIARNVPRSRQKATVAQVLEEAEGQKSKMRKVVAKITNRAIRPGKKEIVKTANYLSACSVGGSTITAKKGRKLVVEALQYAAGNKTEEEFLKFCVDSLRLKDGV